MPARLGKKGATPGSLVTLGDALAMAPPVAQVRRALAPGSAAGGGEGWGGVWIVGGAVRDAALGRAVGDLDLAVRGDPAAVAKAIARGTGGHAFELSPEFGTWRVAPPRAAGSRDRSQTGAGGGDAGRPPRGQIGARDGDRRGLSEGTAPAGACVDVSALRGESIEEDLAMRDFTIGAVAVPLVGGDPIDPHGGLADLDRRLLRAVGQRSFAADPLRLLRAARLAAELDLRLEEGTVALARAAAPSAADPAGERQLAELRQLLGGSDPLRGLTLLDELGLTAVVLPELEALRGVEQGPNHHLDVFGHTLAVLAQILDVEADLERFAGPRAAETAALLEEPLADEMSRRTALRFGALLHDIGKPATRAERDGYITFAGHDRAGAEVIGGICARLRASRALTQHLQALTTHHLRLGFMVHEAPLPRRRVHDYLRATEPVGVDVTLLTVADRLSARGSGPIASEEMVARHLDLAREMVAAALDWRRDGPPPPLLRGDELAAALGIDPGPRLGELLAELEAAQYAGEVGDRGQALALARRALAG